MSYMGLFFNAHCTFRCLAKPSLGVLQGIVSLGHSSLPFAVAADSRCATDCLHGVTIAVGMRLSFNFVNV